MHNAVKLGLMSVQDYGYIFVQSALLFLQLLFHTCDQETAYVTIGGHDQLFQYC